MKQAIHLGMDTLHRSAVFHAFDVEALSTMGPRVRLPYSKGYHQLSMNLMVHGDQRALTNSGHYLLISIMIMICFCLLIVYQVLLDLVSLLLELLCVTFP